MGWSCLKKGSFGVIKAWGDSSNGGTDPGITSGVVTIFSTGRAFAALKSDGSVKVWGCGASDTNSPCYGNYGGTTPTSNNNNIKTIFSTGSAFAALKSDGSVKHGNKMSQQVYCS